MMSDDLIKRSDAIKAIFSKPAYHGSEGSWYHSDDIRDAIDSTPSIDNLQGNFVNKRYLLAEIDDLADEFSEVDENGLHSERWCGILDSRGIIVNAPSISNSPREWIPCSERLPKKDGKYLVTVDKDIYYSGPKREVYYDCGFDIEKQLFYFYTSYTEPHHLGPTETMLRIYIQPNGHIILTGEPIAWIPSLKPYKESE